MLNKYVGLLGMFALAGSMSVMACTTTVTNNAADAAVAADTGSEKTDAKPSTGADAEVAADAAERNMCPVEELTADEQSQLAAAADQGFAPAVQGACSATEISALKTSFTTAQQWNDLKAGLGATCQACLIQSDETQPLKPLFINAQGGGMNFMVESCMSKRSGKPVCGSAYSAIDTCSRYSCQCGDDPQAQEPSQATKDCQEAVLAQDGVCGDSIATWQQKCGFTTQATMDNTTKTCFLQTANPSDAQVFDFLGQLADYYCGSGAVPQAAAQPADAGADVVVPSDAAATDAAATDVYVGDAGSDI